MIKYITRLTTAIMLLCCIAPACAQKPDTQTSQQQKPMNGFMTESRKAPLTGPKVRLTTSEGVIVVQLFDITPRHRDNFIKLVSEGYYDGVLFHRVIKNFMVQTGDPDSRTAAHDAMLGSGGPDYTIDAEFVYPTLYHQRGALAAARTGDQVNPERKSSGSQFYIVTGRTYTSAELGQMQTQLLDQRRQDYFRNLVQANRDKILALQQAGDEAGLRTLQQQYIAETEANVKPEPMPAEMAEVYSTKGGTPFLDTQYTVFGQVLEGMDVVDKIENASTNGQDRPLTDIKIIKAEVIK